MQKFGVFTAAIFVSLLQFAALAQAPDSTKKVVTTYAGSVGITNNGISFVPSFSLNAPAAVMLLSWGRGKFSFDPDIRIASDAQRGSLIGWFRYRLLDKGRFSLRLGAHPGLNFITRTITENGSALKIIQARRYLAGEVVPNFKIKPNWSVGLYYLNGNALQKDGPQTTHFLTLNSGITNIKLGGELRFHVFPAVYYLNADSNIGYFFTATGMLTKDNLPLRLEATINQPFQTDIPGSEDFLWNVTLSYFFEKKLVKKTSAF